MGYLVAAWRAIREGYMVAPWRAIRAIPDCIRRRRRCRREVRAGRQHLGLVEMGDGRRVLPEDAEGTAVCRYCGEGMKYLAEAVRIEAILSNLLKQECWEYGKHLSIGEDTGHVPPGIILCPHCGWRKGELDPILSPRGFGSAWASKRALSKWAVKQGSPIRHPELHERVQAVLAARMMRP